jgi:hypothetical protein
LDSHNISTASNEALQNGAHGASTNGNGRCPSPDHDQCSHGAGRAEKRRNERDNDGPNPDYIEAYQLFEAWCDERGIAPTDRSIFGESLTRKQTAKLTDYAVPSIRIYYYDLGGRRIDFDRLRFLEVSTKDKPIKVAPTFRYWQQSGTAPRAYFPKVDGINWNDIGADTGVKLSIAEGEAKAWALTRAGRPCIGIAGVWMSESLRNGQFLLSELKCINWRGRKVEIVFDADIREKPGVQGACAAVMRELLNRGVKPSSVLLPGPEKGVDDFLKAHGVEEYDRLEREEFALAEPLFRLNSEIALLYNPHSIIVKETGELIATHQARERFANQEVVVVARNGQPQRKPLFSEWLRWRMRHDFKKTDYLPGRTRDLGDTWNSWKDWGADAAEGDTSLWDQLMDHLFGADEEGLMARTYFEQWCAFPIRNPGEKMHVAAVLVSYTQGSGKSLTFNLVGSVYGNNFAEIGPEQLVSTFNEYLVGKQFVLGDEVTNREDIRKQIDAFKRMISRRTVEINSKNLRQYMITDCVNWGLTSNYMDSIYVDDEDRRFFIWKVRGGRLPQQLKDDLVAWWKSGQSAAALRWYFEHIDLAGFDPTERAPDTSAKAEAKQRNKSALELSIDEMLATQRGEATANPSWRGASPTCSRSARYKSTWTCRGTARAPSQTTLLNLAVRPCPLQRSRGAQPYCLPSATQTGGRLRRTRSGWRNTAGGGNSDDVLLHLPLNYHLLIPLLT